MTNQNWSNVNVILMVIMVGIATVVWNYFLMEMKWEEIYNNLKEEIVYNHAVQFGWVENYELAKEAFESSLYVTQQRQQLEEFVSQVKWNNVQNNDNLWLEQNNQNEWVIEQPVQQDDWFQRWNVNLEFVSQVLERWHLLWSEWAKITIIEYSDVNCPFCARHSNDWTIVNVVNQFDWNVNHIFRNFPIFWDRSMPWSLAIECAWNLWWSDTYYSYKKAFFALSNKEDRSSWERLADENWLDLTSFNSCIDNQEVIDVINQNMVEGQRFQVQWTPGNVILNTETGDWVLVPGAYPQSTFNALIEWMLN